MNRISGWQISGSAAQRYETHLVPVIFAPWARDLLKRADVSAGESVIDIACGTGIVARLALKAVIPGGRVVGCDINGGMLTVARAIGEAKDLTIDWIQCAADDVPFADGSFDVVFCQQGLQFFPNRAAAVAEAYRLLKPGGRAVFCVARGVDENPLLQAQVSALSVHLGPGPARAIAAVCGLADRDEIDALFAAPGFSDVSIEAVELTLSHRDGAGFVSGLMAATPAAEAINGLSASNRQSLLHDTLRGFGAYFDGRGLTFPHRSHVIVARK